MGFVEFQKMSASLVVDTATGIDSKTASKQDASIIHCMFSSGVIDHTRTDKLPMLRRVSPHHVFHLDNVLSSSDLGTKKHLFLPKECFFFFCERI